jgi:ribosomal protein L17
VQGDAEKLRRIADKLLAMAEDGDIQAMKEVGDRLDGKPAQSVAVGNEEGETFKVEKIVREIVRTHNSDG